MLTELARTMHSAGIGMALADARQPVIGMARRSRLLDQLGVQGIFHTIDEAIRGLATTPGPLASGVADPEGR